MHRIDTSTAQADKFGEGKNGFTGGNPQTGQLPTALDQDFFDAIQEEISRVIEASGLALSKGNYGQLIQALTLLFAPLTAINGKQDKSDNLTALSALTGAADRMAYFTGSGAMSLSTLTAAGRSLISQANANGMLTYLGALKTANYLSEIAAAGTAAQAAAQSNLGLGAGSLLPVGTPVPWSLATPPSGWLACNGGTFSTAANPQLAIAYPSGTLPDLRGEFIRGWDNARGVDSGRALLSTQGDAIRNITGGNFRTVVTSNSSTAPTGAFSGSQVNSLGGTGIALFESTFDASRVVPTAAENRPRNIAFNYIVRAA